jgi:hypothetical protein
MLSLTVQKEAAMRIFFGLLNGLFFAWIALAQSFAAEAPAYTVTSHWIDVAGARLEGRLYLPAKGVGPFPAVVTVAGSGIGKLSATGSWRIAATRAGKLPSSNDG